MIVAMAILGIFVFTLMNSFDLLGKSQKSLSDSSDIQSAVISTQQLIENELTCGCILNGIDIGPYDWPVQISNPLLTAFPPVNVPSIQYYTTGGGCTPTGNVVMTSGANLPNNPSLQVSGITLSDFAEVAENVFQATLNMDFLKTNMNISIGSPTIHKEISLLLSVTKDTANPIAITATIGGCTSTSNQPTTPIKLIYPSNAPGSANVKVTNWYTPYGQTMTVRLSNGATKTVNSTSLETALSATIDDGGAVQNNTWYYVYLVENNPTDFQIMTSLNHPGVGPDPDGAGGNPPIPFHYVGAILTDAAGAITMFLHVGEKFLFRERQTLIAQPGGAINNSDYELTDGTRFLVPRTAHAVILHSEVLGGANNIPGSVSLGMSQGATISHILRAQFLGVAVPVNYTASSVFEIPIQAPEDVGPPDGRSINYVTSPPNIHAAYVLGWIDPLAGKY